MKIGIIGHGADKFTEESESYVKQLISATIRNYQAASVGTITVVSGHSPVGGIDIWAEELGADLGCDLDIKTPRQNRWDAEYGFKARNLDIANSSDVIYVFLVEKYPEGYKGRRFDKCYHCNSTAHVKSGACWTAKQAQRLGKKAYWVLI